MWIVITTIVIDALTEVRSAALGTSKWEPVKRALRRSRKKRFPTDVRTLSDLDPDKHVPFFCTLRGSLAGQESEEYQERLVVYNGRFCGNQGLSVALKSFR